MDLSSLASVSSLTGLTNTSSLSNLSNLSTDDITTIYSAYNDALSSVSGSNKQSGDFSSILDGMINAIDETNDLQNYAEQAEIEFALGLSENTHDLLIAQTKANVALQYTVAVRDKLIEAYREIMNMQI